MPILGIVSSAITGNLGLVVDYLVVAGGGSGGGGYNNAGGGGGAGGYKTSIGGTALTLNLNTLYTATIGAGGTGANAGNIGSNSVFSTITSTGGGGGDTAR